MTQFNFVQSWSLCLKNYGDGKSGRRGGGRQIFDLLESCNKELFTKTIAMLEDKKKASDFVLSRVLLP